MSNFRFQNNLYRLMKKMEFKTLWLAATLIVFIETKAT